ncbi:MAG TPA: winged helix-turn-helix domain-containing protein [Rhizomicrobium sp.]|jgi:DNA-binding winged helix-turn-helix (wHTH) protein
MNRPNEMRTVFVAVDLAREPDFELGPLSVRPALRRVIRDGREEAVQPRVTQVLVALARAKGAVVSREELVETCWDGIVVGDDSITHSIAKVRQLADCGSTQAFEIETIPRVGYRLRQSGPETAKPVPDSAALPVAPLRAKSSRWIALAAAIVESGASMERRAA